MSLRCPHGLPILPSPYSWTMPVLSVCRVASAVAVLEVGGSFPSCKPFLFVSILWWFLKLLQEMKPGNQTQYKKVFPTKGLTFKDRKVWGGLRDDASNPISLKLKNKDYGRRKRIWVGILCVSSFNPLLPFDINTVTHSGRCGDRGSVMSSFCAAPSTHSEAMLHPPLQRGVFPQ